MSHARLSTLRLLGAGLALLAVSTACGVLGTGGSDSSGSAQTLEFWAYQPPTPDGTQTLDKLRAEFEKANNVKVKLVLIPKDDYNTKLATALSGPGAPDAGYLDQPLVGRYARDGSIAQVPAGTMDETEYFIGAMDTNRVDGALYGLPLDQTTVALFYNKKLVPKPPTTWEELRQTSTAVHEANPKVAGMVVPKGDGYGAWMWPAFVNSAGGTMLDEPKKQVTFAGKPGVEALQLWVDLLASSPRKITDSAKAFESGRAAMTISGPWDVPAIGEQFPDLQFGVAPLPYRDKPGGNIGGENVVVFKKSTHAALAWKWLTFLTDAEHNASIAAALGGFSTNIAAAEAAKTGADPTYGVFLAQLKVARARPSVPQWIQINDELIAPALDRAMSGKSTPEEALRKAATGTGALLKWPAS
jgi:multiple sugar transport system substrate-binding protein